MDLWVEVNDEEFQYWLREVENSFVRMTETMIRVAENIKDEVQSGLSPIRTGKLSRSFRWKILTDNSRMKVLQVQMSALNPRTGYDYAMTQHRGYHTTKSGRRAYYNNQSHNLGFFHYSEDFDGGYDTFSSYGTYKYHSGHSQYLYWGIRYQQNSAFELIEEDYLSMFFGGI